MAPLHSRIFTMLDHEFIEYFETYERLRSLRASLHSSLESGWFELARARCSSGKFSSIGASTLCPQSDTPSQWLMYTNHNHINLRCKDSMPHPSSFLYSSTELESSDRQDLPSHLVLHRARIDVPEGKETESSKAMIKRRNNATIQAPDGDTRNSREVAAASGSTKPSSSSSSDLCLPRYYGMRASAPLRTCQKSFVRALHMLVEMANLELQMKRLHHSFLRLSEGRNICSGESPDDDVPTPTTTTSSHVQEQMQSLEIL